VALSGDGTTALVAAPGGSSGTGGGSGGIGRFGAAYVFTRSNGSWSGATQLPTPATSVFWGQSAALSSDGTTALVTDSYSNGYVFTRSNGSWSSPTELRVDDFGQDEGISGQSVALSSDGTIALLVARRFNSAYVFTLANGSWSGPTPLPLPSGCSCIPSSVALSGDGSTALVEAGGTSSRAGAAYVFTRNMGSWSGPMLLPTPTGGSSYTGNDGYAVALSSDGSIALVGDGYSNTVSAFTRFMGSWSGPTQLSPPSGSSSFGYSVALSSDGSLALVGAPLDNNEAGAVYMFTFSSGFWHSAGQVLAPSAITGVGLSVALSSDGTTALVGGLGTAPALGTMAYALVGDAAGSALGGGGGGGSGDGSPACGWSTGSPPALHHCTKNLPK
jgi:hypothetical protein